MYDGPITTPRQRAQMVFRLLREPYIWPGGYQQHAATENYDAFCHQCVSDKAIRHQLIHSSFSKDRIACLDVHWEGPAIQCVQCNAEIEAVYGDPWAETEVRCA
ncbi:MAG: hypothetical protein HQL98_14815 [Magnetococcales bacterium]|nr:hypothetical protein [Magnetococcales bacterium]